jgi:phosphoribosylformimino-5-aminoimidazole carboxamide ribotide isomerase
VFIVPSVVIGSDVSATEIDRVRQLFGDWTRVGFQRLEIAGLDIGEMRPAETRRFENLLHDFHVSVQMSGRFDSGDDVETALAVGAEFVVLGDRALEELDWLATVTSQFPNQLIVTTPARERRTRNRGAVHTRPLHLRDFAAEVESFPLAGFVIDFPADAELAAPDLGLVEDVVDDLGFPVFVSGGAMTIPSLRDLEFRGVAGAIISATHLSAMYDEQTLARSFSD